MPDQAVYVAQVGKRAALASDQATAEMMSRILAAKSADAPAIVFPGTLRARLDIAACIPFIEGVKQMTAETMGQQPMPPNMQMNPSELIDAELDALLMLMGEIRSYTIGITVSPTAINLCDRVTPMSGTKTASWIAGLTAPSPAYVKAIPENAVFASVGSGMNVMDQIAEPYADLLEKIYAAFGEPMNKMGPLMREMMLQFKDTYAGDIAIGFIPAPGGKGLGMVELVAVKDPAKARQLLSEMYGSYNEKWGKAMPGLTLETLPKRQYKGVDIESFTYKVDDLAAQPATPGLPMTPTMSVKWLDGIRWEMAVTGNNLIYTLGTPEIMNAAIDRLKAGTGSAVNESAAFKKLFPSTSGNVVEYHTWSLCRTARELLAAIPGVPPAVVAAIPSDSPGMAGYSISKGSNLIGLGRISLAEIKAIIEAVPQLAAALPALQSQLGIPGAMGGPGGAMPPMEEPMVPDPAMK
jgi:hypothetical protein